MGYASEHYGIRTARPPRVRELLSQALVEQIQNPLFFDAEFLFFQNRPFLNC